MSTPLDFPNPPLTVGQTWVGTNGVNYVWDGAVWTSNISATGIPPSGAAGGDLTGTYPNPTIAPLAVTDAKIAAMSYSKLIGAPTSLPPTGPAGGMLQGTYPNPTLIPSQQNLWTASGAYLSPIQSSSEIVTLTGMGPAAAGSADALMFGARTAKARLNANNAAAANDAARWTLNRNNTGSPVIADDNTQSTWEACLRLSGLGDDFRLLRSAAGAPATQTQLLQVDNAGNLNVTGGVTAAGAVQSAATVRAGTSGTTGSVVTNNGGASNCGYIAWFNPAGTRQGYMGYGTGTRQNLVLTEGGVTGLDIAGNVTVSSFCDYMARGCICSGPAVSVGASATNVNLTITSVYTDPSGMVNTTYGQIIAPAGNWFMLISASLTFGTINNAGIWIGQWNGSAWVTRAWQNMYGFWGNISLIADTYYGSNFTVFVNNNTATAGTAQLAWLGASLLGKSR